MQSDQIRPPFVPFDMTRYDDIPEAPVTGRVLAVLVGTDMFQTAKGTDGVRLALMAVPPPEDAPPDYYADYSDHMQEFFANGQYRLLLKSEIWLSQNALSGALRSLYACGWQIPEDTAIEDAKARGEARDDAAVERIADLIYDTEATPDQRAAAWVANFGTKLDTTLPTIERLKAFPGLPSVAANMTGDSDPTHSFLFVELVIEEEEFPANSGQWKRKVRYINRPRGAAKTKTKEQAASMVNSLKQRLMAKRAEDAKATSRDVATVAPKATRDGAPRKGPQQFGAALGAKPHNSDGPRVTVRGDVGAEPASDDGPPF